MGTVLVTGSTGAVGGSAATELVRAQHHLVLLGRDLNRLSKTARSIEASQGGARVDTVECDLSSLKSVRTAASEIVERFPRIDGLVNAAAVFVRDRRLTADGFETMFATNHLGPFLLTNLLLERLTASAPARVVTVSAPSTSQLDFDDLGGERRWGALNQFGRSKMANLLFAYALARRQPPAQLTSNIMFPGLVRSGLMKEANVALRAIFGTMSVTSSANLRDHEFCTVHPFFG